MTTDTEYCPWEGKFMTSRGVIRESYCTLPENHDGIHQHLEMVEAVIQ